RLQPVHGRAVRQAVEEALPELALVGGDRLHAADRLEIGDRRREAREELVRRRTDLEAATYRFRRGGARLVWPPGLEQLVAPGGDPDLRRAGLVRRCEEDVTAQRLYVGRNMRRVLHGVDPAQGA